MSKLRSILGSSAKWLQEYHELSTDLTKFEHPADRDSYYQKYEKQIKDLILELLDDTTDDPNWYGELRKKVEEL